MNTTELIEWFENNFVCMTGSHRAWIEVQVSKVEFARFVFQTHCLRTRDPNEPEKCLASAMLASFMPLLDTSAQGSLLLWRLPEKITFLERSVPQYGEIVATGEEVQDRLKPAPVGPEYAQDPVTDNWHRSLGSVREWEIRTRMVIPAVAFLDPPMSVGCRTPEGAPPIYISAAEGSTNGE
jgi:hypothetical protein